MFSKTYTVHYSNLETGSWQLLSQTGSIYIPINMPADMREPGLKVKCKLSKQNDLSSMHMTGEIVRIVSYEIVK
jgi:hypothetical protein